MKWVSCTAEYAIHYCNNSLAGVGGVIQLIMEREKYKKKIFFEFSCFEFPCWHVGNFKNGSVVLYLILKNVLTLICILLMWVYLLTAWRGGQYLSKIIKQTRWKKIGYDNDLVHFANFSMQSVTKNSLQSFKLMRFILDEMT